ncbi:hypothetical protein Esti_005304 [Eimeria stiedai]
MGIMCSCKRGGSGRSSLQPASSEREKQEAAQRQIERMQKVQTAGEEALRNLKTSEALTRAETHRREKIMSARQNLGIRDEQSRGSSSSNLPGDE